MLTKWDIAASDDVPDRHKLFNVTSLVAFYNLINASKLDRKMLRTLCDTHKKLASFHIGVGDVILTPSTFVIRSISGAEKEVDRKTIGIVGQANVALLERQLDVLENETKSAQELVSEWRTEMREFVRVNDSPGSNGGGKGGIDVFISNRCILLVKVGGIVGCTANID